VASDQLRGPKELLAGLTPEPFTILGVRLRPLSLGHLIWLERLGLDDVESMGHLALAVLVCSHKYEDIPAALDDRWLNFKMMLWRTWHRKADEAKTVALFADYIATHTVRPKVSVKEGQGGGEGGAPFLLHVKIVLQSKLNYTPSEAMNCPFNQAALEYYAFAELEGGLTISDEKKDAEMQAQADALDREALIQKAKEMVAKENRMNGSRFK